MRRYAQPPQAGAGPSGPTRAPLGPGSLTWRFLGDSRGLLVALRAGVLQAMHPIIAAALAAHSDVLENPMWRLVRSAGPILGVIYDEEPPGTARWVRDQHRRIRGRDSTIGRYAALDPAVFYWAHATFFEGLIATQELFGKPLRREARRQLYAESVTWYSRYGLSMRPVPADYDGFERYWEHMLEDVLEATPIALAATRADFALGSPHPRLDWPARVLRQPLGVTGAWLIRSMLPPRALTILGASATRLDRLALFGLRGAVRVGWPALPTRLKRFPRAREHPRDPS